MMRIRFTAPLAASLAAIVLTLTVLGAQLPALARALVASAAGEDPTVAAINDNIEQSKAYFATFQQRFDGRSLFFKPDPWPQKPRPVVVKAPEAPLEAPRTEPAKPSVYTGPPVTYAMSHQVWFQGGVSLTVGEEKNGITLLSTDGLPWSVRVGYNGWEGEVTLFGKGSIDLFGDGQTGGSSAASPAAAAPAAPTVAPASEPAKNDGPPQRPPARRATPRPQPLSPPPPQPQPQPEPVPVEEEPVADDEPAEEGGDEPPAEPATEPAPEPEPAPESAEAASPQAGPGTGESSSDNSAAPEAPARRAPPAQAGEARGGESSLLS
jgi:hypothetical protein